MPEPGITDRNFNRPTTDREKPRRRKSRSRIQLPREYADFQLEDGRQAIEVLGESFFMPEGGSGGAFKGNPRFSRDPASAKQTLDRGNAPVFGAPMVSSTDSGMSWEQAMPDGDNEAEFTSLSFGPEEGEPAGAAVNSPIAGRLPAGIGGGAPKPGAGAPDVDSRSIADMDDSGLGGLADSRLDFDELTALKPKTYGDSMRYAAAIAKVAGMRKEEVDGLGSLLTRDENGMPRDVSGADILPSRARENYERFVAAARARRNIPIDIPLTADGKIDYSLVQPGFLYRGGRGVVLNVGPDRKSFVEAPRRPEKVEAAPTKPENGARPAAAKVDPRSIADMDGPWPDVDPRSIAGMDDAGLDVPATRIGKARDTVAALEGVTLPSAVDRVRRDTLKAMVSIYAGEEPPREYARMAHNRLMLDFKAASPAVRESMLVDQIRLLMNEISDNGKRAVGAYTTFKGEMKGLESMTLSQLYDLKRGIMEDRDMAGRQRRNFAILVDKEIAVIDKKYEGGAYQGVGPHFSKREVPYAYGKEPEKYHLEPSDFPGFPDESSWMVWVLVKEEIISTRKWIATNAVKTARKIRIMRENGASEVEVEKVRIEGRELIDGLASKLRRTREEMVEVFQTLPLLVLERMKKVRGDGFVGNQAPQNSPRPATEEAAPPNPNVGAGSAASAQPNTEIPGAPAGVVRESVKFALGGMLEEIPDGPLRPDYLVDMIEADNVIKVPYPYVADQQELKGRARELQREAIRLKRLERQRRTFIKLVKVNEPTEDDQRHISDYDQRISKSRDRIFALTDAIANLVARNTSEEFNAYLLNDNNYQEDTSSWKQLGAAATRGGAMGDVATGAHRMTNSLNRWIDIRGALAQSPDMDPAVVAIMQDELGVNSEQYLRSLDMITGGFQGQIENPASPSLAYTREALGEREYGDVLFAYSRDIAILPEALLEYGARNPGTTLAGIVGSVVAALVFPPGVIIELAVSAGFAALDAGVEAYEAYANEVINIMSVDPDVDFNKPETVQAYWANDEKRSDLLSKAREMAKDSALDEFFKSLLVGAGIGKTRNIRKRDSLLKKNATVTLQEGANFGAGFLRDEN